jgi:two-component system, cell cycle response regulator
MKVLVLATDPKERALIQTALEKNRHVVYSAGTVAEALQSLASDRPRFAIVDEDVGSEPRAEFIGSLRASGQPGIYVLSLTSAVLGPLDTDDIMRKPFTVSELASRVALAQRFLALGDSLNEAREQIESMALYDNLTGLMNRSAFFRTAQGELERARRAAAPLSLISIDLDNFRDLNDAHGTAAGDEALKAVANTIRERSRPYDCIGRWAGDEFLVALPGVIGEDAEKIAGRIIKGLLSAEIMYDNQALTVGISAGIASAQQINTSTEMQPLIDQASRARARAKENGGNQVFLTFV